MTMQRAREPADGDQEITLNITEVEDWIELTFNRAFLTSKEERMYRLLEEVIELAQSADIEPRKIHDMVGIVYSRPKELRIETEWAGSMICLLACCKALGIEDPIGAYNEGIEKCWDNQDTIREKNKFKAIRGRDL